jgi:hypothetical protein
MDVQAIKKQRLAPESQDFMLAHLLDAFIKNKYTIVEDILIHFKDDSFDINAPLETEKWHRRVIFNIIHNEYVRRHSTYYSTYDKEKCYGELVHLYDTLCEIFKHQINSNIKDTNSDRYVNNGRAIENDKTPLMYIIDRLLACEESIQTIKKIFEEFLQRFGKDIDPFVKDHNKQTVFDLCSTQPGDSETIREKKEYIHAMLIKATRKIFITKTELQKLHNCHFRFIQQ